MPEVLIEYDHPTFYPGYEVTGHVVIDTEEAIRGESVQITMEGEARTHWTMSEPYYSYNSTTRYHDVHYKACVPYIKGTAVLWNPPAGVIHAGIHRFPFRFLLPTNCAGSFVGNSGYIQYYCKANIVRPWYKSDEKTEELFTVSTPLDLNCIPHASLPLQISESKERSLMFIKRGAIQMTVNINKRSVVPGETLVVETDIINGTSKRIKKIEVKLAQSIHYIAYRQNGLFTNVLAAATGLSGHETKREEKKVIHRVEDDIDLAEGATEKLTRFVPIPDLTASFNNCPIISLDYYLRVKITTNGMSKTTLSTHLPVIIGNIPIRIAPVTVPYPLPSSVPPTYNECVYEVGRVGNQPYPEANAPPSQVYPSITPSAPEM